VLRFSLCLIRQKLNNCWNEGGIARAENFLNFTPTSGDSLPFRGPIQTTPMHNITKQLSFVATFTRKNQLELFMCLAAKYQRHRHT